MSLRNEILTIATIFIIIYNINSCDANTTGNKIKINNYKINTIVHYTISPITIHYLRL